MFLLHAKLVIVTIKNSLFICFRLFPLTILMYTQYAINNKTEGTYSLLKY